MEVPIFHFKKALAGRRGEVAPSARIFWLDGQFPFELSKTKLLRPLIYPFSIWDFIPPVPMINIIRNNL